MSRTISRRARCTAMIAVTAAVMAATVVSIILPGRAWADSSAAGSCPCTLWSGQATPSLIDSGDANGVELGTRFYSDTNGWVQGLRFYKAAANTGTHVGSLWTTGGQLLGDVTFSGESTSGWQEANFALPVPISAGTSYIVSYYAPEGHYSADPGYFATTGVDAPPLHAPASTTATPNGVFAYSPYPTFPGDTYNSTNYWVDPVFDTTEPAVPVPPANAVATTLFGPTAVPTTVDSGDGNSVNVGVTFYSDEAGWVSGVRFYKSAANLGSHVGSLYTARGALLSQATFTGETATGWQQVTFPQPVPITAGTLYVASYFAPDGHYSADPNFFSTTGVDSPPLHAPANSSSTPNGVFKYSPVPAFPGSTYNSNNYWVEPVVLTASTAPPPPTLTGIAIIDDSSSLPRGVTEPFTATGTYSDGSTQDLTSKVTWSSSNPAAASISASGVATAVAPGASTITASLDGLTGSASLTVTRPIVFIAVTGDPLIGVGTHRTLTATAVLSNFTLLNVSPLARWASTNSSAVSVSNPGGAVTGVGAGAALITATVGSSRGALPVIVLTPGSMPVWRVAPS